jgi:DHA1 family multidrug resistance protein-like MFS transporter
VGLPFLPRWGALADRYARRPVIVRSFLCHLLAGVLALLAGSVWVFVLARALMSLSLGNTGLMMATLAERAPRRRQGLCFGMLNGAQPAGAFLGPLLGGPVVDVWGFRALLALDAGLMLVVVLALAFGHRDDFARSGRGSVVGMAAASVRLVWEDARLRGLFATLFILFAGWLMAYAYVPLAVTARYGGADAGTAIGLVMGSAGLATVAFGPLLGALADRFGGRRVLIAGAVAEVALWPLPALAPGLAGFAVGWALLSGVAGGVFALSFGVLADAAVPRARGRVMALSGIPSNAAYVLGPVLGSVVTRGGVFAVFPAGAALTALGLATVFVLDGRFVRAAPPPTPTVASRAPEMPLETGESHALSEARSDFAERRIRPQGRVRQVTQQ